MEAVEPQNKYINLVDICGNDVSILDTDVNYEYDMDYDFDTKRYIIYHTLDVCGNLYYSIEQTDFQTNNWINDIYDTHYIKSKCGVIVNVGTDTEYKIFNKNKLASELFGIDVAGNVLFWLDEEFLNETEIKEQLKSIKNSSIHSGLIDYRNIRI